MDNLTQSIPEGSGNPQPMNKRVSLPPLPTRKVGASALAGALSIVMVFVVNSFFLTGEIKVTGEVASALTTILTLVVGYFVADA